MTDKNTLVQQIEVAGDELVSRIKDLVKDGKSKRVVIKSAEGHELLTLPLNVGVVGGGVMALAAPLLAAVGAIAALVSRVTLEVVQEEPHPSDVQDTPPSA